MRSTTFYYIGIFLLLTVLCVVPRQGSAQNTESLRFLDPPAGNSLSTTLETVPQLGCWFLSTAESFTEPGYKDFIDTIASTESFGLFSASTRYEVEVVDREFHDMMKNAANYAKEKYGVGILLDLDARLARKAFEKKRPDKLQEQLQYLETPLAAGGPTDVVFQTGFLNDHYTGGSTPYLIRGHRFLKAWTYSKNAQGEILSESLRDVTKNVTISSEENNRVKMFFEPGDAETGERFLCGVVAFSYFYPDVFSPELIAFEKEILQQYADVPLAGACKDEWGFPPSFDGCPAKNEFWYSDAMDKEYAKRYPDRSLVDDCFLMWFPQAGKEESRRQFIDDYNRLCLLKHAEIESQFAKHTKEVFGPKSLSATHPTWWPWPDAREFRKNQLSWWKAPRDFAQTDECTPYFCRTSLAKGTNSVWYNMFYSSDVSQYGPEHWGAILAGGRINIHPIYPAEERRSQENGYNILPILDSGVREMREKARLLGFITNSPVDSPVAVVFGHFGAMNWARPDFNKVGTTGIDLCNRLAFQGFPADLTPSTQSDSGLWTRNDRGYLQYGVQEYPIVVFFGETPSDQADFETLRKLNAVGGKTQILSIASDISPENLDREADALVKRLVAQGVTPQTAWITATPWADYGMARPACLGKARYVDGTHVWIAAEKNLAGDEIVLRNEILDDLPARPKITAEATGLLACRFTPDGTLVALAAGNLKKFAGGGVTVDMENKPTNIALWKDVQGKWTGVFQSENELPPKGLDFLKRL